MSCIDTRQTTSLLKHFHALCPAAPALSTLNATVSQLKHCHDSGQVQHTQAQGNRHVWLTCPCGSLISPFALCRSLAMVISWALTWLSNHLLDKHSRSVTASNFGRHRQGRLCAVPPCLFQSRISCVARCILLTAVVCAVSPKSGRTSCCRHRHPLTRRSPHKILPPRAAQPAHWWC